MSVPNQRRIIVMRTTEAVRKDYFKISNANLRLAMYNLKGNAFKLYCYLCDNKNQWELDLYPCDFQRVANVSADTYRSSFKQLVDKGYLVPSKTRKNVYQFVEESKTADPIPIEEDEIEVVDQEEFETLRDKEFS